MDVSTSSYTTITCSIDLSPDEQFDYKRSWWTRARRVSHLTIQESHFKMFERKRGTLMSISRDSQPQNVHFGLDEVPGMPAQLRIVVEKNLARMHEEHILANPPASMLF